MSTFAPGTPPEVINAFNASFYGGADPFDPRVVEFLETGIWPGDTAGGLGATTAGVSRVPPVSLLVRLGKLLPFLFAAGAVWVAFKK